MAKEEVDAEIKTKQVENDVNDDDDTDIEDEDFVPEANDGAVSEEISDDADEDAQTNKTDKKKSRGKKRKRPKKLANGKRRKTEDESDTEDSEDDADFVLNSSRLEAEGHPNDKSLSAEEAKVKEEDEKAEIDRLWADFKSSVEADKAKKLNKEKTVEKVVNKVYDFAGEKVSVQEKVRVVVSERTQSDLKNGANGEDSSTSSSSIPTPSPNDGQQPGPSSQINGDPKSTSSPSKAPNPPPKRRRGGISILGNDPEAIGLDDLEKRGLSGLLKAFQNKSKSIGTLEKSKLDWESFKRQQGLEDELVHHNRSRDTFIDKQEFLQRADYRQFEIEKNLRATQRSKRLAN